MFTVKFIESTPTGRAAISWHLPNPKPGRSPFNTVLLLSADGDELECIRCRFYNIPIVRGNHCCWEGEMAEFIFKNL